MQYGSPLEMKRVAQVTEQLIEDLRRSRGSHKEHQIHPRVLVIEDDLNDIILIKRVLDVFGCETTVATSSAEALSIVKDSICPTQPDFDIVFLDLGLPGVGGAEVLRCIRSLNKSLPVVVVTGDANLAAREDIAQAGYVAMVNKPLNVESASEILSKHRINTEFRP